MLDIYAQRMCQVLSAEAAGHNEFLFRQRLHSSNYFIAPIFLGFIFDFLYIAVEVLLEVMLLPLDEVEQNTWLMYCTATIQRRWLKLENLSW